MRYEIRAIRRLDRDGFKALHADALESYDDYPTAVERADELGTAYEYGVVLVDFEEREIEWGDRVTDFAGETEAC